MPEGEEKKKWRTKLITKTKNTSSHGPEGAKTFYFRLLDYEKSYKKMIASINSYTPYRLVFDYYEPMVLTNKNELLKAILNKGDDYIWSFTERGEEDKQCFPDLVAAMVKTYGKEPLLAAVRQMEATRFYYRRSGFIDYLKKALVES